MIFGTPHGHLSNYTISDYIVTDTNIKNVPSRNNSAKLIILSFVLSGCASVHTPYAPRPIFSIDEDISQFHEQFASAASIKDYYTAGPETKERRNVFIAGRLTLYDLEYIRFISRFRLGRAGESTAMDAAALGVGFATTIVAGERAKTILGAVTTALTGARASYEKNFYDDKTASALAVQMSAERKTALIPIMAGARSSIEDYPLSTAIVDLAAYQFAGSVDGALAGVQRDASIKDAKATATLEQYRKVSFAPDDATTRIEKWLYPGLKSFDGNGVAINDQGTEIIVSADNLRKLRTELKKIGLDGLPISSFLTVGSLANARATTIADLSIP